MGTPLSELYDKIKRVKRALSIWSKEEFGNIFIQKATLEDVIQVKESQFKIDPSLENRAELSRVEAELRRYLKLGEQFWRQKAGMNWFT